MHTIIKRYKQKLERLNRYSVKNLYSTDEIIDKQTNSIIYTSLNSFSASKCYIIYNTFTDEHYMHITQTIWDQSNNRSKVMHFYPIQNFKKHITLPESRMDNIYSPIDNVGGIMQTNVSIVFPILDKLVKFNYKLPYRLYSIDSYKPNYIGTVFIVVFNLYDEDYDIYASITDTIRKSYPETSFRLTHANLFGNYIKDYTNVTILNFFNNTIYLQLTYNYWKNMFRHYKEHVLFDILI
jgi:hypothetical protein